MSKFTKFHGVRAYIRVSSRSQDYEMQHHAITQMAKVRADSIGHWYSDKRSAKNLDRPALDQLLADVRAGLVTRLYIWRLDRLARSGIRDTLNVIQVFRDRGVQLISVTDNINMDGGPMSDVMIAVLAAAAQIERISINERISAARDRMEAEGRDWGRPRRLDDAAVARLRQLRKQGRTIRELAVALKVPRSTISDALRPRARKAVSEKGGPVSASSGKARGARSAPLSV